ncbi:MAG: hypothetical protein C0425_06930 [Chlorobiaceae bacterium]|nr:hypothetical protein [Chlorobiaceae bacterium]
MKQIILISLFLFSVVGYSQTDSLTFSEVMFNSSGTNNEFIEIYNLSSQPVDLSNHRIKYSTATPDVIVSAGFGTILPARSYAVILEGDYDSLSGIYNALIPPSALRLRISDNAFGASGLANTEARQLWIIRGTTDTLETYTYSANNATGISDEKIILSKNNLASNWLNSLVLNGTPGAKNSVTPLLFDVAVSRINILPAVPIQGNNVSISAIVRNLGANNADNFNVTIFNDTNFDSVGTVQEQLLSQNISSLRSLDSIAVSTSINNAPLGNYQILVRVTLVGDENILNNNLISRFTVFPPGNNFNDVVINEIMYAPTSPEPEWIEIFNRSNSAINLRNWRISDPAANAIVSTLSLTLPAKSFIVLSRDSSIFNHYSVPSLVRVINLPILNNNADVIYLSDSTGLIIDSVSYVSTWGGSSGGRSLERINTELGSNDRTNWKTSEGVIKATPGRINSVTPKNNDLAISNFSTLTNFAIQGGQIVFATTVRNRGLLTSQSYRLNIFYDQNIDSIAQESELVNSNNFSALNANDSARHNFSFSGFDIGRNYFIAQIATTIDEDTSNNFAFTNFNAVNINEIRNDLVINEIMYAPTSPEPEWIEIFNRSNKQINLMNYKIGDRGDTSIVISTPIILSPKEFIVIARDSSIRNFYSINSKIVFRSFPILNNDFDHIMLLDSLNRVIDSVHYLSRWGGGSNKSLERKNPNLSSLDSANWSSSTSRLRATPGSINSVTQKDYDIIVNDIIFNPTAPTFGNDVNIFASVKNIGLNNSQFILQLFEDTNLDSIPDNLIETSSQILLNVNDSTRHSFNFKILNLINERSFVVKAIYNLDQDTINNVGIKSIFSGLERNKIVINEIMFVPTGGEPEWIEIYNTTNDSVSLRDYTITDIVTTPVTARITSNIFIPANSYLVLARDQSIVNYYRHIPSRIVVVPLPVLNNDADGVILRDRRGSVMDSVRYVSNWGNRSNASLERKEISAPSNNPSNWASSLDIEFSTPGRLNSVTPKEQDLTVASLKAENEFFRSGESVAINAVVRNQGLNPSTQFTITFSVDTDSNNIPDRIFSSRTISNQINPADSIVVTSDLLTNIVKRTLISVNIHYPSDNDTLNNYFESFIESGYPQIFSLITEVMYAPIVGPEWIELYNPTKEDLNLKNWSLSDNVQTNKISLSFVDLVLGPNEYLVIARDSTFYNFYSTQSKIIIRNFSSLSNTEDEVNIFDQRDSRIGKMKYNSKQGGRNGKSLERINLSNLAISDSINWSTSLSPNGNTVGAENSFTLIPAYEKNSLVINEIMFEPDIDNSEFIEFYNPTNSDINLGGWRVEDENKNFFVVSDTSLILTPNSYFILAADSIILSMFSHLSNDKYKNIVNQSSLGLTNSGELILLKDVKGNVIDSVVYSDNWTNRNLLITKNTSLERINPSLSGNDSKNWNSSVAALGSTPALKNSIFTQLETMTSNISISPNPFSPDNDGFEDFAIINYNLSASTSQIRVRIFDSNGRLVRTLANNQGSGSSGAITFDGLDDSGNPLRIGIYVVLLEALNSSNGVEDKEKTVIVVARKL